MSGNKSLPGSLCQEEAPLDVNDGTAALTRSPSAATEEDVSYEIQASFAPVSTHIAGLNPAELQVLAWLRTNRSLIVNAEQRFRVDRRAIAGAIAWEMLENVIRTPRTDLSVGVGKIHTFQASKGHPVSSLWSSMKGFATGDRGVDTMGKEVEEFGYLPAQSFESRKALLATKEGGITYIAAIMAAVADIAAQHHFDDVRCDPVILTNVYQGRTLSSWNALLGKKAAGTSFSGGNPMDVWVGSHLLFIEDGVGKPDLPESETVPASFMPAGPAPAGPLKTVTVAKNSSLSEIARTEYGSVDLWPLIYDLNLSKIGTNPNLVAAGLSLSIAPLSSYTPEQIAWARHNAPSWRRFR